MIPSNLVVAGSSPAGGTLLDLRQKMLDTGLTLEFPPEWAEWVPRSAATQNQSGAAAETPLMMTETYGLRTGTSQRRTVCLSVFREVTPLVIIQAARVPRVVRAVTNGSDELRVTEI